MKIVIDIPEDMYQRIAVTPRCASGLDAFKDRDVFVKAIQKGEPLPKGHGNLIDANELLKEKIRFEDFDGDTFNIIHEETVINAKTIIKADTESEAGNDKT